MNPNSPAALCRQLERRNPERPAQLCNRLERRAVLAEVKAAEVDLAHTLAATQGYDPLGRDRDQRDAAIRAARDRLNRARERLR